MQHSIVYNRPGYYSAGPVPHLLPDGRIAVGLISSPFADHYGLTDWVVVVSDDRGETFTVTEDGSIPLCWPGTNPRECYDRYAGILDDGTCLTAGTVGFEVWSKARRSEAEEMGFSIHDHPNLRGEEIVVSTPRIFTQRSNDRGNTWRRKEWIVPGLGWLTAFPRWTRLGSGEILLPMYGANQDGSRGQNFVFRSDPEGHDWRLYPICPGISDVKGDETCFYEVEPGRVLALMRHATNSPLTEGYLLESWSEDGGITWSHPMLTDIRGYPPHIIRLQDGRLLCAVTHRWAPMGIRAVVSGDNGRSWDTTHTIILRDDAGTPSELWHEGLHSTGAADVGYPVTVQLDDGMLFTCYWITTEDGITHAAATRWRVG